MAPKNDLVAAGFGTPAQKKAAELARRRERLAKAIQTAAPTPSASLALLSAKGDEPSSSSSDPPAPQHDGVAETLAAGPSSGIPLDIPGPVPRVHDGEDVTVQKYKNKIAELEDANADLYDKVADREDDIEKLTSQCDLLKQQLNEKRKEIGGMNNLLRDTEKAQETADNAFEKEAESHRKTRSELQGVKNKEAELRQLVTTLRNDLKEEKQQRDTIRSERDNIQTDLDHAQQQIDELENQLQQQQDEADQGREYLHVIHEELEEQFAEEGKELTPDNFGLHFRRVSQQAAINRNASGDSNASSQQHGADTKRRSLGQRTASMAQELDDAQQQYESDDEANANANANTTDDLHVEKRRPQSSGNDISSSSYTIAEQRQKITDQARQISKLEQDHKKEIEELRAQSAQDLQKDIEDQRAQIAELKEEIAAGNKYIAGLEDQIFKIQKDDQMRAAAQKQASRNDSSESDYDKIDEAEKHEAKQNDVANDYSMKQDAASQTDESPIDPLAAPTHNVRYIERIRDAKLWEAFTRSPFWLQTILSFSLICLIICAVGRPTKNMYHAANAHAPHHVRCKHAPNAVSGLWSRLEDSAGYDSRLLG